MIADTPSDPVAEMREAAAQPTREELNLVAVLLNERFNGYWIPATNPRSPMDLREDEAQLREAIRVTYHWIQGLDAPAPQPTSEPVAWAVVDRQGTVISVWREKLLAEQDAKEWAFSAAGQPHKPFSVFPLYLATPPLDREARRGRVAKALMMRDGFRNLQFAELGQLEQKTYLNVADAILRAADGIQEEV